MNKFLHKISASRPPAPRVRTPPRPRVQTPPKPRVQTPPKPRVQTPPKPRVRTPSPNYKSPARVRYRNPNNTTLRAWLKKPKSAKRYGEQPPFTAQTRFIQNVLNERAHLMKKHRDPAYPRNRRIGNLARIRHLDNIIAHLYRGENPPIKKRSPSPMRRLKPMINKKRLYPITE
jgi:hypothetical protein